MTVPTPPTSDKVVEEVARAIAQHIYGHNEAGADRYWPDCIREARKILAVPSVASALTLQRVVVETSKMIDASYPDHLCSEAVDRRRFDKLAEELGEVTEAYCGMVGENPRKGITHTLQDVLAELLDVAACALGAYEHLDGHAGNSVDALSEQTARKCARLRAVVEENPL